MTAIKLICDFGIIGTARMTYHPERCIGCGACVKACEQRATRVLSKNEETQKIEKTHAAVWGAENV